MYEVKIDFHDNAAAQTKKRFSKLTDLGLYLERVPSMLGFEFNPNITIDINVVSNMNQIPLPIDGLKA